jgi:soluble lytic murein transglycosylase-like protein
MTRGWVYGLVFLCALFGATGRASGDIYMYRDRQGTLHFSNAPSSPGYRQFIPEYHSTKLPPFGASARVRRRLFDGIIRDSADRHGVELALVKAVIHVESDFVPQARSPKGALGLMQLMPATAQQYGVWRVFDPQENVNAGVKHLRLLLDRYGGNVRLALAAYNAGVEAVERYGGVPPYRETTDYLNRVLYYRLQYLRE